MVDLTLAEMETHLNMSGDNRDLWEITSDDPVMVRRLKAIGATFVKRVGVLHYFTLPANQVTLRKARELTDEQRAALRERAKVMQAARAMQQ